MKAAHPDEVLKRVFKRMKVLGLSVRELAHEAKIPSSVVWEVQQKKREPSFKNYKKFYNWLCKDAKNSGGPGVQEKKANDKSVEILSGEDS